MTDKTFTISGMSCGGCVNSLTRVLKSVPGIEPLKIEVGKAQLRLDDRASSQTVKDAVARAGFEVTERGVIMTPLDWAIAASAIALIAFVNWFFLGTKGTAVVAAAAAPGGDRRRHRPSSRAAIRRRPIEVPAGSRGAPDVRSPGRQPVLGRNRHSGLRDPQAARRPRQDQPRIHRDTGPPRILVRHGHAARRDHREVGAMSDIGHRITTSHSRSPCRSRA